ncbi:MAG: hypothetical protein AABZ39_04625 [Spirochaetota bacterium]
MTDAALELRKLPSASLRKIFSAWHAPFGNFKELAKRFSDPAIVLTQIAALSERQRRIIVLLSFEHAEVDAGSLVSKLHEAVKREVDAFHDIQCLAELGFVYLRRKRGRLNQVEDKVFLFPPLKGIVHAAVLRDVTDASPGTGEYDKVALKKHERAVRTLYEAGGSLTCRFADSIFTLPMIAELAHARILSLYLVNDPVMLAAVLSPSVRADIERRNKRDASRLEFEYNHYGLVNDIESFLYALESHRIRKLKNGAYDLSIIEKNGMSLVTPGISVAEIAGMAASLFLAKENGDGDLIISAEYANWRTERPEWKMERVRSLYREKMPELADVKAIISAEPMTLATLAAELNRRVPRYSAPEVLRIVRTLFVLGECEAGGVSGAHIDSVRTHEISSGGKCLVSNSFEAVVMMPAAFDSEFMYLLMSFAVRTERAQVHTFVFTEESVLKGKHLLAGESDPLGHFLELLKNAHAAGKPLSRNVELSLRRWYDRSPEITVHMHAVLLEADSPTRLAELAVSAKKEGLHLERIAERHARIVSPDAHPRKITRFLRKEKMIARIID